ncbi:MAG: hypothetical protein L0Y73_00265 [Candidatus Aminicenantes bacterium]|nr:hypothetical protein [Candidatus Aminicenantes bacterium]
MRKRISVTPNVEYSLQVLEKAVQSLPEGEAKEKAKKAIAFLQNTAKGERQSGRVNGCSHPVLVWP